ncbi:CRAL-TRIO domain-containing protein, partial [Gorgonomyces haynaldii]
IRELEKSVQNIITDYRTTQHIAAQDLNHFAEILMDHFLFYRFHKKFGDKTLEMLQRHIDWRIQHLLSSLSPEMLLPEARVLFEDGLFRFHKQDVHSRPVLYLTPRIYDPNTFDLNHLQQALFLCLETMRRWLMSLEQPTFTVVVDLKGFGLSQLGYDLIPFLYETFQRHYPQIVGQAIVLNYGWVHAGLWSVVRQSLTPEARERLVFIDQDKMSQYIPAESIPTMYGGQDPDFPVHPKVCPILNTFGQTDNPLTQTMEYEHLLNQL